MPPPAECWHVTDVCSRAGRLASIRVRASPLAASPPHLSLIFRTRVTANACCLRAEESEVGILTLYARASRTLVSSRPSLSEIAGSAAREALR